MAYKWGLAIAILLSGCATTEHVVYQNVYIPQRCAVQSPSRPSRQTNPALTNIMIIEYARQLEAALDYCKGDND